MGRLQKSSTVNTANPKHSSPKGFQMGNNASSSPKKEKIGKDAERDRGHLQPPPSPSTALAAETGQASFGSTTADYPDPPTPDNSNTSSTGAHPSAASSQQTGLLKSEHPKFMFDPNKRIWTQQQQQQQPPPSSSKFATPVFKFEPPKQAPVFGTTHIPPYPAPFGWSPSAQFGSKNIANDSVPSFALPAERSRSPTILPLTATYVHSCSASVEPTTIETIEKQAQNQDNNEAKPNLFQLLKEQTAMQKSPVDPAYSSFPCRYMHTANTMEGSHQTSRYSQSDAFYGMEPSKIVSDSWTEVPKAETFTLGNGIALTGGTRYKRIQGSLGVAVKVEGMIIAGIVPIEPHNCIGWEWETTEVPAQSIISSVTERAKRLLSQDTQLVPLPHNIDIPPLESDNKLYAHLDVVNVLPSTAEKPFALHKYEPATRIGLHLVLLEGSFLDSEMIIHGPFVYRGIKFGPNALIHADGVFAKFQLVKNNPTDAEGGKGDGKAQFFYKHLEAIKAAQARQDKANNAQDGDKEVAKAKKEDGDGSKPNGQRKQIYVEICVDRMLNPEPFAPAGESNGKVLPPTDRPATVRSASNTVMTFSQPPSDAATLRQSNMPTIDCYGYHSTILPARTLALMRRPLSLCHENAVAANEIEHAHQERRCAYCGVTRVREKMALCSQCKCVRYCSKECQKLHWRIEHKKWCQAAAIIADQWLKANPKYTVQEQEERRQQLMSTIEKKVDDVRKAAEGTEEGKGKVQVRREGHSHLRDMGLTMKDQKELRRVGIKLNMFPPGRDGLSSSSAGPAHLSKESPAKASAQTQTSPVVASVSDDRVRPTLSPWQNNDKREGPSKPPRSSSPQAPLKKAGMQSSSRPATPKTGTEYKPDCFEVTLRNIPQAIDKDLIAKTFSRIGEVTSVEPKSEGIAKVRFRRAADANKAMEYKVRVKGRTLILENQKTKEAYIAESQTAPAPDAKKLESPGVPNTPLTSQSFTPVNSEPTPGARSQANVATNGPPGLGTKPSMTSTADKRPPILLKQSDVKRPPGAKAKAGVRLAKRK